LGEPPFPIPANEDARLRALEHYGILDTLPERSFDDFAQLAAIICGTPIAMISLLDDHRQWFKARVGISATETPREDAFCARAIMDPTSVMVVEDSHADDRFAKSALVLGDPYIRFYAGAPLVTPTGEALGTLCVIDTVPREITPLQITGLQMLAAQVVSQLELRRSILTLEDVVLKQETHVKELKNSTRDLKIAESKLIAAAMTDALTGIPNRRALKGRLEEEHDRSIRYGTHLAVVMIDIDHFKDINDALGHQAGDAVLATVAQLLRQELRAHDMIARYGGEEFLAILPNTGLPGGLVMAERFRRTIERAAWEFRPLTVSAGVSSALAGSIPQRDLVKLADSALLRAKKSGRNRVCGPADLLIG
jgi:diguanylate cyclase (GGDEF)-like protein